MPKIPLFIYRSSKTSLTWRGEFGNSTIFTLTFANSGHVLEPHGTTLECGEEGEKMGVRDGRRKIWRKKTAEEKKQQEKVGAHAHEPTWIRSTRLLGRAPIPVEERPIINRSTLRSAHELVAVVEELCLTRLPIGEEELLLSSSTCSGSSLWVGSTGCVENKDLLLLLLSSIDLNFLLSPMPPPTTPPIPDCNLCAKR
jgi:hypothetical protein